MSEKMDFADGKYTVINDNGNLTALRHGEPWGRDLTGDNLVYWMLVDSLRLKEQRDLLLEALKEYGWHHEGCPQYPTHTHPDRWPACTCGFDDAIKAVEGESHAKSL